MTRSLPLMLMSVLLLSGCGSPTDTEQRQENPSPQQQSNLNSQTQNTGANPPTTKAPTFNQARKNFTTRIVKPGEFAGPPSVPPANAPFRLIHYPSAVGPLAAYVSKSPADGKRHPAIVWITGGDNNSIGDVWTRLPRGNDQHVSAFHQAGIVTMFPSQRGGNDNPGRREGFFGEVDDILAATDYLEKLPYVDPQQIYLGGHSTGGTMVLMVAAATNRYRAVFSLGPVAAANHYGGDCIYCDLNNTEEIRLRSPMFWLSSIESPTYVLEGANQGNWMSIQEMQRVNQNSRVRFFRVPGFNHFSVIAPVAELVARQIVENNVQLTDQQISNLR